MRPSQLLNNHRSEVIGIFEKYPDIMNPRIFGSVARGEDTETSDLDILVDIKPFTSLFVIAGLQSELEDLFPSLKIDLIDSSSFAQSSHIKFYGFLCGNQV